MEEGIGTDLFRAAMRRLPAQVCVIACRAAGTRTAMTATAVTSLSAEPPQLLVCVHRQSRPAALIREAGAFTVNLVARTQVEVAERCALRGLEPEERFAFGDWNDSPALSQPMLDGAVVSFECRLAAEAGHGTHWVFVGSIINAVVSDQAPLLYHDASYREIGGRVDALHLEWDTAFQGF